MSFETYCKYIQVEGTIKSLHQYHESAIANANIYTDVTLYTEDGQELFFQFLYIPKRYVNKVPVGIQFKMLLLRYRKKDRLVGALYALEHDGVRTFMEIDATKSVTHLAQHNRARGAMAVNPETKIVHTFCATLAMIIGGSCGLALAAGIHIGVLGLLLPAFAGGYPFWYFMEPIWRASHYARVDLMKAEASRYGYKDEEIVSVKY